jgi:hypothetical protein
MALAPTPPSYHSIFLNLPDFYLSLSSLCVEMHLPIHTDMVERRDGTMEDDYKNWWVPSNIFLGLKNCCKISYLCHFSANNTFAFLKVVSYNILEH